MSSVVYVFVDVELDGPDPGKNSMRSIGCCACTDAGAELDSFERNLMPLVGTAPDPRTLAWWQNQSDAWAALQENPFEPEQAIHDLVDWVESLPGSPAFAAHPLILDGLWVDWYLRRFTERRLFAGPIGDPLFVGAGVDIPSYLQALLDLPYVMDRPRYPQELLAGVSHSHRALDDARGHATLFFNARRMAAS